MEKPDSSSSELQCVGRLEIVKPKPVVGFICGTIPVPTDEAFHAALVPSSSSSSSSSQKVRAPRYRMLPTETDLNLPPFPSNFPDKAFPVASMPAKTSGELHWESGAISQNLARKCEALAVSGLAEYGDELDVVAPVDILKQIFKIPYSKARLSVAVQRVGQTLVLNSGPDLEEGEKMARRQSNQSKGDQSIFLNFAMHSVRVEACDCPPTQYVPPEESSSTILPGHVESREGSFVSSACPTQGNRSKFFDGSIGGSRKEGFDCHGEYSEGDQESFFWGGKQSRQNKRHDPVKKTSQVGEKARCPVQEAEKHRRAGNDGFLRVLFWQFHNFRMLLGSDLLLFSNEKYLAVSLHLWDVARQVTPLTWLDAWLDNVMASVPELAICYHENGVVQGYELLKTDDIFILKGISEDGTPAFHPQVVQQNGLSVLRFLQDNCKQDPGAYWLYKSAGEDMIQLFDLSVLPKNCSSDVHDDGCSSLPSLMHRGRRDALFSLGTLLYRLGHRLSLSKAPNNRAKCARLFKKCLEFLDEQDHLVVRAYAHEQFARLILKSYEELDLASEHVLVESEVIVTDVEDKSVEFSQEVFGSIIQDNMSSHVAENAPLTEDERILQHPEPEKMTMEPNPYPPRNIHTSEGDELGELMMAGHNIDDSLAVCQVSATNSHVIQSVADPIPSKLAAVHHISQAIKSLGWKCQLQNPEGDLMDHGNKTHDRSSHIDFSICACGDADCIEVCDIREWLPRSKMDQKLWKLVLLLGESYLALGQAYKEDGQLHQALKVVEVACYVYGSMPQQLEDAQFISSMVGASSPQLTFSDKSRKRNSVLGGPTESDGNPIEECISNDFSSNYLFWAKAWALVGDVYVEYHLIRGKEPSVHPERKAPVGDWRVSNEVAREVKRLKKKLGQYKKNCSTCSLINCSCQSDRTSSGNSASSSGGDARPMSYGRKQTKKPNIKCYQNSPFGILESDQVSSKADGGNIFESKCLDNDRSRNGHSHISDPTIDKPEVSCLDAFPRGADGTSEIHGTGSRLSVEYESQIRDAPNAKSGGIFKFLKGPKIGDVEYNLSAAIGCYDAARKAMYGLPTGSTEMLSIVKRKGWACNELGRYRLDNKNLHTAELAFVEAIKAFKEVADHTNIILINCNLGHGRRALAEAMVSKMENYKKHGLLQDAYKQALQTAKLEYSESLRFYSAALSELNIVGEGADLASKNLWNEVKTQLAHTYLRLGMLLAREDISAEVATRTLEELPIGDIHRTERRLKKEPRKHEVSANDAIREALCIYESLGELRKQEAAYAYFQLACYHRDCCLKFLDIDDKQIKSAKCESNLLQKVKWYASLAERNWQRSIDFYGPKTHSIMYLTIVMERSALFFRLSGSLHSNMMLESALSQLLEGRHVVGESSSDLSACQNAEVQAKFWGQLQSLLKKMLATASSGNSSKSSAAALASSTNRAGDVGKLRELYRMSLKSTSLSQLHSMYELWA